MERAGPTLSGEASSLRESVSWARVWSLPSLAITYSTLTTLRTCAGTWVREGGSVRAEQQRDTANIEPCDPVQGLPDANKAGCLQACTEAGRTRFWLTGLSRKCLGQATADLETRTEQACPQLLHSRARLGWPHGAPATQRVPRRRALVVGGGQEALVPFPQIHHAVPRLLRPGRRKQAEAQREQMWAMLGNKAPGELTDICRHCPHGSLLSKPLYAP